MQPWQERAVSVGAEASTVGTGAALLELILLLAAERLELTAGDKASWACRAAECWIETAELSNKCIKHSTVPFVNENQKTQLHQLHTQLIKSCYEYPEWAQILSNLK